MKKLLVLTSTFPRWKDDAEPPFVFELCRYLSSHYEVIVLAPHSQHALFEENLSGIRVKRFSYFLENYETLCYQGGMLARLRQQPLRYFLIPFFIAAQLISAYRLIKSENISIIHAHWIIPQGAIAYLLRYLAPHPIHILCTSHGGDLFSLKGGLFRFIKRKILLDADAISVVSPIMKREVDLICQPFKPPVSVIPMGIDLQHRFVPSSAEKKPFSLIFVGRLVPKKGVSYLIEAMPSILERFPETSLTIVGDGPEKNKLIKQAKGLSMEPYIYFTGAVLNVDLPHLYQNHMIAVFPFIVANDGDREGLGLVIAEAIGCGCSVVTTNIPGMSDLIVHNHSGSLVEPKNSSALADEVVRLFSNPKRIHDLQSTAFKETISSLDLQIISNKYISLIDSL